MVYAHVRQKQLEEKAKKEKAREGHRRFRRNMSDDKKEKYKEAARLRAQKSRDRKKAAEADAPKTRSAAEVKEEKWRYNREYQRKRRAAMSTQKKQAIRKQDRESKRLAKEVKSSKKAAASLARKERQASSKKKAEKIESLIESATPSTSKLLKGASIFKSSHRSSMNTHLEVTRELFKNAPTKKRYLGIAKELEINKTHHASLTGVSRTAYNYKAQRNIRKTILNHKKYNLTKFLEGISVSTEFPNKKDVKNGKPLFILKRSLKETYKMYTETENHISMSFSSFATLVPSHVRKSAAAKWRQCLCTSCENVQLLLKALRFTMTKDTIDLPPTYASTSELCSATLCSAPSWQCYDRNCGKCNVDQVIKPLKVWKSLSPKISVHQWEKVEHSFKGKTTARLTKVTKTLCRDNFVELLRLQLQDYPKHHFLASFQWQQYVASMDEVERGAAVCVLDFAENYTCSVQGEVQSAYYSRNSVTLHPIVATYKLDGRIIRDSIVFISDDLKHDWAAVKAFVQGLSAHMQMMAPDVRKLVLWSDGCAAQYKSRLPFASICQSFNQPLELRWNWFGSGHGKGPSDGESGVIKSYVTRFVKSNEETVVENAKQFYDVCQLNLTKLDGDSRRHIYYIPEQQIQCIRDKPYNSKGIAGCRQIHSMKPSANGFVQHRRLSCFCLSSTGHASHLCEKSWRASRLTLDDVGAYNEGTDSGEERMTATATTSTNNQTIKEFMTNTDLFQTASDSDSD